MIQLDLGQPETLLCRQVVEQPAEVVEVFLAALNCNASMFVDNVLTMFVDSPELQCTNVCWQSLLTMFVSSEGALYVMMTYDIDRYTATF